jgi:hypothetical protein
MRAADSFYYRNLPLMAMYLPVIDDINAPNEFYGSALFASCAAMYFTEFLLSMHGNLDSGLL